MGDADPFANCPLETERISDFKYDPAEGHQHFQVENLTVIRPPLLKYYYWTVFEIDELNKKLLANENRIEHTIHIPTRHVNSKPLKIIFWLRSLNKHRITLNMKRIQNCECQPLETQVGFNQFRFCYHCPHRRLLNISQEFQHILPYKLVAMSAVAFFYILGTYILTYEIHCSDSRLIVLHFRINIVTFDPYRSILTRELIPVNIQEGRRMAQAIWVRNITMNNIQFRFVARNRGFRLVNSNLVVPRQSVWPLVVEYRPSDFENNLELTLIFEGFRCNVSLTCKGLTEDYVEQPCCIPLNDYECADYLYVVYPNKLQFVDEINEERTLMVALHNHDQVCRRFKWQTYSINGLFTISFEPSDFTLKPHHSKLCVVLCKAYTKPLHFTCVPAVMEIHSILDKSTQIAQNLLTEVESIDDPKWEHHSYIQHFLLHIDIKVNYPPLVPVAVIEEPLTTPPIITIFEKLFWDYLSRSNFMRNTSKIPKTLTYEQVIERTSGAKSAEVPVDLNKNSILCYISCMLAESCREISKNYRFVPKDILDTP